MDALASGTTPLFWAVARGRKEAATLLFSHGADAAVSGPKHPSALDWGVENLNGNLERHYRAYGSTALAAALDNPDAFETGNPSLPPLAKVELSFTSVAPYNGKALISVEAQNTGKGDLFKLLGTVSVDGRSLNKTMMFGKLAPQEQVIRTLAFSDFKYTDTGREIPFTIDFVEANHYDPPPLQGKIRIMEPDSAFLIDNINNLTTEEIKHFLSKNYFSATDISRSVLLRASDLDMPIIKNFLAAELIDKTTIDKLIHFEKIPYSIDDLVYFAEKKAITQNYLELALLEHKVKFAAADLVGLSQSGYLSRQVVEAFYSDGMAFNQQQVQQLAANGLFTLPEILYTYTISDGDSPSSSGNQDGMIQVREGVDFHFIIKNASNFDLSDVDIKLDKEETAIGLFNNSMTIGTLGRDQTITLNATIGVQSNFTGNSLPLSVVVENPQFGTLLNESIEVPVGQTVGSQVLALNKQVTADGNIIVRSGASEQAPRIASLANGAVFTATGELNGWYKVEVYGRNGWIEKSRTSDYSQPTESSFLVANLRESAGGLVDDSGDVGVYGEMAFVNARPMLVVITPRNNDDVYNAATLDIQAADRTFGISKIDVRINGAPLSDADARGLRNLGGVVNRELRKSIPIKLKKGTNTVAITAYNSRNVASDTQTLTLNSQGIKNPPSMYVLSVGVSRYAKADQNLRYAKSDAEKIAALFKAQGNSDIYKNVKIKTLYDDQATRANIKEGVNYFLAEARKDDVAVFYFAGHGTTDARGEYYLMGHDSDMERPSTMGYRNSDLEQDLQSSIYADKVLVMLDSCRSGEATGSRGAADIDAVVEQLVLASGYNVISAARGNEAAWEKAEWGGGAFTYAIIQALKDGIGDQDKDGFVSVDELNESVYHQVLQLTDGAQHPTAKKLKSEPYSFYQVGR